MLWETSIYGEFENIIKKTLIYIISAVLVVFITIGAVIFIPKKDKDVPAINSQVTTSSISDSPENTLTSSKTSKSAESKKPISSVSSNKDEFQSQVQSEESKYVPNHQDCKHEYEIERKEPISCVESGYERRTCKLCGISYSNVLVNKTHKETVITVPATCTMYGTITVSCEVCGEILSNKTIAASGHKFSSNGKCSVCGFTEVKQENVSSKEEEKEPVVSTPINKIKIYIDQGHNMNGYVNSGAQGNGLDEGQINYTVGILLKEILEESGKFEIMLSRPTESTVLGTDSASSLKARYDAANLWGADYFISLHCNSASAQTANGIEVFTYKSSGTGYDLGLNILNSLISETGLRNRGIKTNPSLAVLKHTVMPAVLVEMGFISNPTEAEYIKNNTSVLANGIYNGILKYFEI